MIGKKIKDFVDDSGLSVQEVASKMGTSTSNLYVIFKKKHISTEYLELFSSILGIPISAFFENYNEIKPQVPEPKQQVEEEMTTVVENLQGALNVLEQEVKELKRDKEELRRDKEDIRRDKERVFEMLEKALAFRHSVKEESGKLEGSESERLSQAPKEAPRPGRAQSARKAVVGERATTA